ncbi:aldo/keto reductase [Streptococcus cameli]
MTREHQSLQMPPIGFGTFGLQKQEGEDLIQVAVANGFRLFDAANRYQNERVVGRGLQASGVARHDYYLTSKIWPTDFAAYKLKKALATTLDRLQTDYLDLVLLHRPIGDYKTAWKALEEEVLAGRIKAIGLSNFSISQIKEILSTARIRPTVLQEECHPYYQQKEMKTFAQKENMTIQAWYPLGSGKSGLLQETILKDLATKHHTTPVNIILAWHLHSGVVPIVGSKNPAHIASNLDSQAIKLSADEIQVIEGLDKNQPLFTEPKWWTWIMCHIGMIHQA